MNFILECTSVTWKQLEFFKFLFTFFFRALLSLMQIIPNPAARYFGTVYRLLVYVEFFPSTYGKRLFSALLLLIFQGGSVSGPGAFPCIWVVIRDSTEYSLGTLGRMLCSFLLCVTLTCELKYLLLPRLSSRSSQLRESSEALAVCCSHPYGLQTLSIQ